MIEGFGREIPEPEMAEAIMTAHRYNQEIVALATRASRRDRPAAHGSPTRRPTLWATCCTSVTPRIFARRCRSSASKNETRRPKRLEPRRGRSLPRRFRDRRRGDAASGQRGVPRPPRTGSSRVDPQRPTTRRSRPAGPTPLELRGGHLAPHHGSAIFQRGETQALVTTVLGTAADEQRVNSIMEEYTKKFMLDYNMPSFAVGKVRPIRGPGRREFGHGARRALRRSRLARAEAVPVHDPSRQRHS